MRPASIRAIPAGPAIFMCTLLVCFGFLSQPEAGADHRQNSGLATFNRDNNNHVFIRRDLTAAGQAACNWGAKELDASSEITTSAWVSGKNDVNCYDGDYDEPWFGLASCTVVLDANTCDVYSVQFDLDYGQIDNPTERGYYEYVGCHEFGHTSSIGHRASGSGCMVINNPSSYLDAHDRDAINADFP